MTININKKYCTESGIPVTIREPSAPKQYCFDKWHDVPKVRQCNGTYRFP